MAQPPRRTYIGGCHCGAIKYKVALTLEHDPKASRCNCTICLKSGFTSVRVGSPEEFKLVLPVSSQPSPDNNLGDYQMRSKDIHKYFCKKCGVHVWQEGKYEFDGTEVSFFNVNLLSLDQPQPQGSEGADLDLSKFKIEYWDGRNDNWAGGLKDVPWTGGCV